MEKDDIISEKFLLQLHRLISLRQLQSDILDDLGATIMWILNYAKKTHTDVPNLDGLLYLLGRINRAMKVMYPEDESSDESLQSSKSDADLTEPRNIGFLRLTHLI
jgi:hypothetical protein